MRGCQRIKDGRRDAIQIAEDFIVPKSKHAIAVFIEKGCSAIVAVTFTMLAAVRFDDQSLILADKIGNEGADWLLAAEFGAFELGVAEDRP